MANINRIITITQEGAKAGPFFDVYYSLDCINYTICSDGSNVYLPVVGSQVTVTLPDNSTCLKLQSLSPDCPGVFIVENLVTTTTTSTTTTSTTTTSTTTTTTAGPTTTTTTTSAPKFWNAIYCNNFQPVAVPLKMAGVATTGSVVQAGSDTTTCATLTSVYSGTPFIFFDKTAATIYSSCTSCNGITTTTTTTQAPVWYNLYNCSNGQTQTSAQYPAGTFSVNQRVVYGGTLFFYVISSTTTDPGGIQWSVSSAGAGLTGCPATTTTTTTTTLPPVRLSLTGSCSGNNNVLLANNFRGGNGVYQSVASGSSESNAFSAQQIPLSGASSYTFNNLPNGTWYVVLRDSAGNAGYTSASLQCNSTTTTSTTTTVAPPTYSFLTNTGRNGSSAACSATKTIYLWSYSNTWDNALTYYEGTISGPNLPLSPYPGASQWFAYGGNALQIDDNGISSNLTPCPTTTTTTSTTTTTTTAAPTTTTTTTTTTTLQPVWYNLYNCFDGSSTTSAQYTIGTFSVGQRVAYGSGGSILYFNVISQVTSNPGGIQWNVYGTGDTGCPATTTTTTTTTTPPVDFTYTTSCSNGLGTITITGITGGTGTGYQFSIQPTPGFWYDYPTFTQLTNLASGQYYSVAVRDSAGKGTNKAIFIDCATTTTTTTTQAPARVNVNFFLTLESGNDGTLEIYSASPASSGYTLNETLTFDGASYQLSLLPGDGFYSKITQTARAAINQRGQITTDDGYYVTGAGSLPKSVSSDPIIVTAGHAPYNTYGLCGDQI